MPRPRDVDGDHVDAGHVEPKQPGGPAGGGGVVGMHAVGEVFDHTSFGGRLDVAERRERAGRRHALEREPDRRECGSTAVVGRKRLEPLPRRFFQFEPTHLGDEFGDRVHAIPPDPLGQSFGDELQLAADHLQAMADAGDVSLDEDAV